MDEFASLLKENRIFYPSKKFSQNAHIKSFEEYKKIYEESVKNPEAFWAEKANELDWFRKWDSVLRNDQGFFKWFENGYLNVSYNCLDRHIKNGNGKKTALIFEPEKGKTIKYTYLQLYREVCKFGNVLKKHGAV